MQIADREAVYVISAERETETIHFLCEVAKKQEDFRTPSKLTFFVLFFFLAGTFERLIENPKLNNSNSGILLD